VGVLVGLEQVRKLVRGKLMCHGTPAGARSGRLSASASAVCRFPFQYDGHVNAGTARSGTPSPTDNRTVTMLVYVLSERAAGGGRERGHDVFVLGHIRASSPCIIRRQHPRGLHPGTRLGPYEIQSALGAGGTGEVCLASHARLGRDVATKVLPSACSADAEPLHRLEQEARAADPLRQARVNPWPARRAR